MPDLNNMLLQELGYGELLPVRGADNRKVLVARACILLLVPDAESCAMALQAEGQGD